MGLTRRRSAVTDRAIRRAGELLKQVEPGKPGPKPELTVGADTQFSRKDMAERAGMSPRQHVTAVRVANVPVEDFERQVESAKPPTISQLAQQGIKRPAPKPVIDLKGRATDKLTRDRLLENGPGFEPEVEAVRPPHVWMAPDLQE
ncbi:hypothetical protein KIP88_39905, partial [Bradyrhizobium sp. SRL28]|uniref:hypothetical protein n=1 Tax=Bradyrhizobium sp. SRL28 TaxID=2836178 RepID=UPI001BDE1973